MSIDISSQNYQCAGAGYAAGTKLKPATHTFAQHSIRNFNQSRSRIHVYIAQRIRKELRDWSKFLMLCYAKTCVTGFILIANAADTITSTRVGCTVAKQQTTDILFSKRVHTITFSIKILNNKFDKTQFSRYHWKAYNVVLLYAVFK